MNQVDGTQTTKVQMKLFRRYEGNKSEAYCSYFVVYASGWSPLHICQYRDQILSCGYVDSLPYGVREASMLDLLLDLGISRRRIEKVVYSLQHRNMSISADEILRFLEGKQEVLREWNKIHG